MTTAQVTVLFAGLTLHLAPVVVETGVQVVFFTKLNFESEVDV